LTILENFDLPTMNPNCTNRIESTVVPQALHLLNNQMVHRLSAGFADRVFQEVGVLQEVTDVQEIETARLRQVEHIYRLAFGRRPTPAETTRAVGLLQQLADQWRQQQDGASAGSAEVAVDVDRRALANLCHAIMNSAEFIHVD
jgi:hypothetical protein